MLCAENGGPRGRRLVWVTIDPAVGRSPFGAMFLTPSPQSWLFFSSFFKL